MTKRSDGVQSAKANRGSVQRREAQPRKREELNAQQREHWERILKEIDARGEMLESLDVVDENEAALDMGLPSLDRERRSTALLIDGERGTGKSTVLVSVVRECVRSVIRDGDGEFNFAHTDPLVTSIVDFAGANERAPVLLLFVQSFERLVNSLLRRGMRDEVQTPLEQAWFHLQRLAAQQANGTPPGWLRGEEKTLELSEQAGAFLDLDSVLSAFLLALDAAWRQTPEARRSRRRMVVVVAIDDADAHESRCVDLVKLLRSVGHHRQLVFLLAADLTVIRHMLHQFFEQKFLGSSSARRPDDLDSRAVDARRGYATESEGKRLADRLALDVLVRVFPVATQFRLEPLSDIDCLTAEIPTDLALDEAKTVRLATLLKPLAEWLWVADPHNPDTIERVLYPGMFRLRFREIVELVARLTNVHHKVADLNAAPPGDGEPSVIAIHLAKELVDAAVESEEWRPSNGSGDPRVWIRMMPVITLGEAPRREYRLVCDVRGLRYVVETEPMAQTGRELFRYDYGAESVAVTRQTILHRMRASWIEGADPTDERRPFSDRSSLALALCVAVEASYPNAVRREIPVSFDGGAFIQWVWEQQQTQLRFEPPSDCWLNISEAVDFDSLWQRWVRRVPRGDRSAWASVFLVCLALVIFPDPLGLRATMAGNFESLLREQGASHREQWAQFVRDLEDWMISVTPSGVDRSQLRRWLLSCGMLQVPELGLAKGNFLDPFVIFDQFGDPKPEREEVLRRIGSEIDEIGQRDPEYLRLWKRWQKEALSRTFRDETLASVAERMSLIAIAEVAPRGERSLRPYWLRPFVVTVSANLPQSLLRAFAAVQTVDDLVRVCLDLLALANTRRVPVRYGAAGTVVHWEHRSGRSSRVFSSFDDRDVYAEFVGSTWDWGAEYETAHRILADIAADRLSNLVALRARCVFGGGAPDSTVDTAVLPFAGLSIGTSAGIPAGLAVVPRYDAPLDSELLGFVWGVSYSALIRSGNRYDDNRLAADRAVRLLIDVVVAVHQTRSMAAVPVEYDPERAIESLSTRLNFELGDSPRDDAFKQWLCLLALFAAPEMGLSLSFSTAILDAWESCLSRIQRTGTDAARLVVGTRNTLRGMFYNQQSLERAEATVDRSLPWFSRVEKLAQSTDEPEEPAKVFEERATRGRAQSATNGRAVSVARAGSGKERESESPSRPRKKS